MNLKREIDESYDIIIEQNCIRRIAEDLSEKKIGNKYAIITDSIVQELYGQTLLQELENLKTKACLIVFPAGEKSKNFATIQFLMEHLIKNRLDRKSAIISLGGGVVGDTAGFTASIFMRGISLIQVPTTLLAQVDSSVGGKTAVDIPEGKNLAGSFHQPKIVYIDPCTLKSLADKEFRNGLAEIIKYGIIHDSEFFEYLERNIDRIRNREPTVLAHIIEVSCKSKQKIVEEDPNEENKRSILNYGHTPAHAIEKLSDFKITHGEAVAKGMGISGYLALRKGFWQTKDLERQNRLLERVGFNLGCKFDAKEIITALHHDKKTEDENIRFAFPERIGKMVAINGEYRITVSEKELREYLSYLPQS